jgi:hypothetical protein
MSGTVADNIDRQSGVIAEPAGGPEVRSDDPSASEGTVWFNTTSGVLKVYRLVAGWSTGNAMLTAVKQQGGAGLITAGLSFGGNDGSRTTECEEFDGTSWSVSGVGNLATATTNGAAFGTQTAGLYASGQTASGTSVRTEEYDGSTWSAGGDLQEAQHNTGGFGTQTAGTRFGGEN